MSERTIKRNFSLYGTPTKPARDIRDCIEEGDDGYESENRIDEILKEIDETQKRKPVKRESIHEWLERLSKEPDDERPLREILGIPPDEVRRVLGDLTESSAI